MELDALILAEAATATEEGKFFIHGGGFTRFDVPRLPAPIPLDVLIRLRADVADLAKEQRLNLVLMGPQGIPNVEPIEVLAIPPGSGEPDLVEGQEQFLQIALTIPGVALRTGLYHVELRVNGRLAKKVPLPVVLDERADQGGHSDEPPRGKPAGSSSRPRSGSSSGKKAPPPPRQRQKRRR